MKVCELIQSRAICDMTGPKDKKLWPEHEGMSKTLYIDLEVKGQRRLQLFHDKMKRQLQSFSAKIGSEPQKGTF